LNTVINPNTSFIDRQTTNSISAFINMYFDLVEIEKRKLAIAIKNLSTTTIDELNKLYEKHNKNLKIQLDSFSKDVFHGINKDGMYKWNKYIYDILGINNILTFELFPEEMNSQVAN
jgi:hypothetical protein